MVLTETEIERRFTYWGRHAQARKEQVDAMAQLRRTLWDAARRVVELAPDCRETSLAVTKLEAALAWAIAAIVRPPAYTQRVEKEG